MEKFIAKHFGQFAKVGAVRPNPMAIKKERPMTNFIMGMTNFKTELNSK
ncbi:MAG: hypothetical protein WA810_10550 [Maribacter sp.]